MLAIACITGDVLKKVMGKLWFQGLVLAMSPLAGRRQPCRSRRHASQAGAQCAAPAGAGCQTWLGVCFGGHLRCQVFCCPRCPARPAVLHPANPLFSLVTACFCGDHLLRASCSVGNSLAQLSFCHCQNSSSTRSEPCSFSWQLHLDPGSDAAIDQTPPGAAPDF